MKRAKEPFVFHTRLSLRELTGLRAVRLSQLVKYLRTVPGSVVFHHTHHYLEQHQFLSPEPPNDFAYWVNEILGDKALGEQLASIDTVQFGTIRALREQLIETMDRALQARPLLRLRAAPAEEAFHFVKAVSIVLPTPYQARDLKEFSECLRSVTAESLYFHIFEARIRLERGRNDFSRWFEEELGEAALAKSVERLDPYTHTMEDLRQTILRRVRERIRQIEGS